MTDIVFVPFAVAIWALGHLGLRLTHWLLRRGLAGLVGDRAPWPLPVVLTIVGSGVMSFLFVVFLGATRFCAAQLSPGTSRDARRRLGATAILLTASSHRPRCPHANKPREGIRVSKRRSGTGRHATCRNAGP